MIKQGTTSLTDKIFSSEVLKILDDTQINT